MPMQNVTLCPLPLCKMERYRGLVSFPFKAMNKTVMDLR